MAELLIFCIFGIALVLFAPLWCAVEWWLEGRPCKLADYIKEVLN